MTDWRFTSDGEPSYYAESAGPDVAGTVMPGYRPGTVVGNILESDLWDTLAVTKLWLVEVNRGNFDDLEDPDSIWDDYLWKVEADTNFLYCDPDRDGVQVYDQRIVSGAFGVTDELGWMGFSACFSHELQVLSIEVDGRWSVIYQAGDDPNA
jgi:hypothetical protein